MKITDRISFEEMRGIVAAMDAVAGKAFPGMSLQYSEALLQQGSWDSYDARECVVEVRLSVLPPFRRQIVSHAGLGEGGDSARAKLLMRLADDGWPLARSAEEMSLKLAAAGAGAFRRVCASYVMRP